VSDRSIVLCGAPLVGKRTLLESMGPVREVGKLRRVWLRERRLDLIAFSGAAGAEAGLPDHLPQASAMMLVLAPHRARDASNRDCVERVLKLRPPLAGCLVVTMTDVQTPEIDVTATVGSFFEDWPVFLTRSDRSATMRAPFESLEAALSRGQLVRRQQQRVRTQSPGRT
jgi:hypothetical protein